ncbi:hypothetical protein MMC27_007368 [Xylographa pallens]|nr:hypothetical protein [Xylographa pallens]
MCRLTHTRLTIRSAHSRTYTRTKTYIAYCAFLSTCPTFLARQRVPQTVAAAALEIREAQEIHAESRAHEERGPSVIDEKSGLDGDAEEEDWEPDPVRLEASGTLVQGKFRKPPKGKRRRRAGLVPVHVC